MKTHFTHALMAALLGLVFTAELHAQGTAFTYQGRLQSDGAAYSGPAEFQFTLWDAAEDGSQLAITTPETLSGTVSEGLFTLVLDFGDGPFTGGEDRWLEIELRTGLGEFEVLTPRQKINTAPYALTAATVTGPVPAGQLDGALPSANLAGTYSSAVTLNNTGNSFSGDGEGLTGLNASELADGVVPDDRLPGDVARTDQVWLLGGNAGTTAGTQFIGTTDSQPLEFKVNDARALRLEFHTNHAEVGSPSPNVISGHADNEVAPGVSGATIAGGGGTNWWGPTLPQRVSGEFSTIGGGIGNTVEAEVGVIAGGERGFIGSNAFNAFIGGGAWNTNLSSDATIGGGRFNLIPVNANNATVGGGGINTASGADSVVPGGRNNTAAGVSSFAAGRNATANHRGAFVWADSDDGGFASIQADEFAIRAANGVRILNRGNGAKLLRFDTERSWEFRQFSSGAGTALELGTVETTNPKNFIIRANAVGINTTAPTHLLHVNGVARSAQSSWATSSDRRAKHNIFALEGSLERVARLRPVSFEYTPEYTAGHEGYEGRFTGFIAQEVEPVFPGMVETVHEKIGDREVDDFHLLNAGGLTPHLVAAIKELDGGSQRSEANIRNLEQKLQQKETEITELKARMSKLEELLNGP